MRRGGRQRIEDRSGGSGASHGALVGPSPTRRPPGWLVGGRPPSGQTVDLGYELPVGGPGRFQLLGARLELLAQVHGGLLELGHLAPQLLGVIGSAEAAGAEDLLTQRLRQASGQLGDLAAEPLAVGAAVGQVGQQRLAADLGGARQEASGWAWAARVRIWARRSW